MAIDPTGASPELSRRSVLTGVLGIGAAALASPLLSACSSGNGTPGAISASGTPSATSSSSGTMSVINRWSDPVSKKSFETLIAEFKAATGIDMSNQVLPDNGATYTPALRAALSSSNPPTLAVEVAGPEVFSFASAGQLADLSETYNKIKTRANSAATLGTTLDGKVYGLASGPYVGNFMAYNADYLGKLGISPADLVDTNGFNAALKEIKASGGQALTIGLKDQWPGGHYLGFIMQRRLGSDKCTQLYNRTVIAGQPDDIKWTDEQVVQSFQDFVDLTPYFQDGFLGEDQATSTSSFLSGKNVAFLLGAPGLGQLISSPPPFTYGQFLYPAVNGGEGNPKDVTLYNQVFVASKNADTSQLDAFFEYFTRPDVQSRWASGQFCVSAYAYDKASVTVDPAVATLYANQLQWLAEAPAAALFNDELIDVNIYTKYIWQGSVGLASKAISPAELASQLESATVAAQSKLT